MWVEIEFGVGFDHVLTEDVEGSFWVVQVLVVLEELDGDFEFLMLE